MEVIIILGAIVVSFLVGAAYGAMNAQTVDKAIAAITAAENSAKATLAKIVAHKAA